MIAIACTFPSFSGLRAADEPVVMAYYYPWYVRGDWTRHDYVGTPILGRYGTDSPETTAQHIQWCADHRIDGFFVSWWGADHLADEHLRSGLLKASNLKQIRFALYYECLGLLDRQDGAEDGVVDFSKPAVMVKLIDDFHYLAKNYLSHPQYLKIAERPVVGFYVTRTFKGFTRDHLDRLRRAIDVNLYAIADEAFFGEQASPITARHGVGLFDAYTAYNMFENPKVQDSDSALSYQSREAFPIFREWAKHVHFIPAVFPSYADFRGNKPLAGNPADFANLVDAASAIANQPQPGAARMILLTSFNEWWEGTTIEPAREYGTSYLKVIQDFKARPDK
jgi:hypothetical protein